LSPATASLLALLFAIALSMTTRINVGLLSMALAWLVGWLVAGQSADAIMRGFPAGLFVTLAGVTLLFSAAEANGTLERLAERAVRLARGSARILPILFFVIAGLVSAVGPGAVSSVALVAPLAMAIGVRAGVPPFLISLMVANGANAGNLSPVSAVGIIANTRMTGAGLGGHWGKVMAANMIASALVALVAYFSLGGHRLKGEAAASTRAAAAALSRPQQFTVAIVLIWIAAVLVWQLPVGLAAIAAAVLLIALRATDESRAIQRIPWSVILMVTGVTMLVALLEATGGMALFTAALAKLATPASINGVIALVTGGISLYSSTSGVVLPAFLPTVPGLVKQLGGGDPLAVALSINVGSSLVDVSPLSTLGALCLAALPAGQPAAPLFRKLMIWGVAMAVVGAIICQLFAGLLSRV
jgi:Na+/H+ antiporter NhaD/arsenite permease-like protein